MKTYISCDLDGVCGVVDRGQLFDSASADYLHACRLLTAEVNSAVEGALAGGATEVVVNDGHTLEWHFNDILSAYRTFVVTYYLSRGVEL